MTRKISPNQIKSFQKHILSWYAKNKRNLPWRSTNDPYKILVSEVMSQQTQILRIVPKYEAWLQEFPLIQNLAEASIRDVLKHWSGLGYNRRALYLQKCAVVISSRARNLNEIFHKVRDDKYWYWPQREKELMQLPGIGKYTAQAILCFAFNKQVTVVDTNVRKVIITQFLTKSSLREAKRRGNPSKNKIVSHSFAMTDKEIEEIAVQLLPKGKARDWNQALMDYASIELKNHPSTQFTLSSSKGSGNKIPFKDSDRFYRGQIIKCLIQQEKISFEEFGKTFPGVQKERLKKIVDGLEKDKMIIKKNHIYTLV